MASSAWLTHHDAAGVAGFRLLGLLVWAARWCLGVGPVRLSALLHTGEGGFGKCGRTLTASAERAGRRCAWSDLRSDGTRVVVRTGTGRDV